MNATAAKDRKQQERDRKREAGLVPVQEWVHRDDAGRLRKYAAKLRKADRETLQNALIYGQPKRYTQPPAPCPKCYSLEQGMHLLSERIGELEESSKFAWQNARTIDKSRMETEAQLTQLRAELDEWRNGERRYAPLTQDYKEVVAEIRKLRLRREE